MKTKTKKVLLAAASVALVAAIAAGGTYAYLQSGTEDVVNTFSTNNVTVTLTETGTDENGNKQYNIVPGTWESKDPTVTVDNSVDCYVFVKVEDTSNGVVTWDPADGWKLLDGYTDVYYREVTADDGEKKFAVISGDRVSYSASLTNEDLSALGDAATLTFTAYAIQKDGFADAITAYLCKDANFIADSSSLSSSIRSKSATVLTADVDMSSQAALALSKNSLLVLDGTITHTNTAGKVSAFWIYGSIGRTPTLTIDGSGGVTATNVYCFEVGRSKNQCANLVINGGRYFAPVSVIQCNYGTVTITGGFFACDPATEAYGSGYLLNCLDSSYTAGTAKFVVTGGTFVNFDPSNSAAEPEQVNWVPDGYTVISETQANGDIWYTVVPVTETP